MVLAVENPCQSISMVKYGNIKIEIVCIAWITSVNVDSYTLLSILLISRSMDLRKITCISSLCSCDKLLFPSSSSSFFFFNLLLPALALNVFFSFSNHQGAVFFFFLLSLPLSVLNGIMQKAIFS